MLPREIEVEMQAVERELDARPGMKAGLTRLRALRDAVAAALAQAPAAPPTCATCQHFREHQAFWCGKGISQLYPGGGAQAPMHPLPSFGCNLHTPRPASAAPRFGVITSGLRLTDEEDSKALWLTRRLMPKLSNP